MSIVKLCNSRRDFSNLPPLESSFYKLLPILLLKLPQLCVNLEYLEEVVLIPRNRIDVQQLSNPQLYVHFSFQPNNFHEIKGTIETRNKNHKIEIGDFTGFLNGIEREEVPASFIEGQVSDLGEFLIGFVNERPVNFTQRDTITADLLRHFQDEAVTLERGRERERERERESEDRSPFLRDRSFWSSSFRSANRLLENHVPSGLPN